MLPMFLKPTLFNTLKAYNGTLASADISAALIVSIMLIPQSLAYALLAGLPPVVGLYASILPLALYAMFGSSSSLAVGPVAVISLMTGSTIYLVATETAYAPIDIAVSLAFLSGLILLCMGFLKMGFIVDFLSRSVIEGFIFASAILIAVSQFKHFLAVDYNGHSLIDMLVALTQQASQIHLPTFGFGLALLVLLLLAKAPLSKLLSRLGLANKQIDFHQPTGACH